ncbi:MAG: hypothetical protein JNK05_40840 [Myxococcales bacterium]|nr:hypothetical protein [Myxococcales bacterium]
MIATASVLMKNGARALVLASGCAVFSGCYGHVQLPDAPLRSAPFATRAEAYNAYRPRYAELSGSERAAATDRHAFASGLPLANGTTVYHPEDLLPMAGRDSRTAAATRDEERARRTGDVLVWSGLGATVLGLLICGVGFSALLSSWRPQSPAEPIVVFTAGGVIGGAGVLAMVFSIGSFGEASVFRERSYRAYDRSVRANLGLCGEGAHVTECSAIVAPAPPRAPEQPAQSPSAVEATNAQGPTLR